MYAVNRFAVIASLLAFLSLSSGTNAEPPSQQPLSPYGYDDGGAYVRPSAEEMLFDGLFVRPVSLAGTLAGTVVYIVTLPFSALSGNSQEAAERLIAEPAQYTFTRCFGCVGTRYWGYWSERH
ncbi:MAG: hypothetical protein ACREXR_23350 [Gammaproteobacteria bacterium]